MNILLTSVGRRPYLVRWFRDALAENGIEGLVIAADLDANAPAKAFADQFVVAPRADDAGYQRWLQRTLQDSDVDLAVSINDFELSEWATLPQTDDWKALVRLAPQVQDLVEDKLAMSRALEEAGVRVPRTHLGSATDALESGRYVTKGRFGSASRGLRFANAENLPEAVADASREVTTRQGVAAADQSDVPAEDLVVIQDHIDGTEYGLDVVCDLAGNYQGVLARRKIAMRAGETDRAESVAPDHFQDVARAIAGAVPHPGTIDVDIIEDEEGHLWVIDVNPRFGGGYPLSHVAGARVPAAYVAWAAGTQPNEAWLRAEAGTTAGKYVEAVAL